MLIAYSNPKRLRVGSQGRVVIPANIRQELGIVSGDIVIVRVNDGQFILEKPKNVLARLQATFENVPNEVALADELIAERREAGARESEL